MTFSIDDLLDKFQIFVRENKLAGKKDKILLAVSGGLDSRVMTDLFIRSEFRVSIAHCNFMLRGKESDNEEKFVLKLAGKSGLPFHVKQFETESYAKKNKYSIQLAARKLRYHWLKQLCEDFSYDKIATAHHLDDSIETFFINLLRGTGPAGLRGIPMVNGKTIRPLLFARRDEIAAYALSHSLSFVSDSSNEKDDYLRNRIRHHVIPVLKGHAHAFEPNMQKLMHEMTFFHNLTMLNLEDWMRKHLKKDSLERIYIPLRALKKEVNPTTFLSGLLYALGITGVECEKIIKTTLPGKLFYAGNFEILRDRQYLVIRKKLSRETGEIEIPKLPFKYQTDELHIHIHKEFESAKPMPKPGVDIQHIDGDQLVFPLTIRTWKQGDYFFPLGMKGKKKISDFYTDNKLSRFEKDNTFILLSGKNIVCILGRRIDERVKIKTTTKNIVTIETIKK